ncbi:MAG: SUMF1/EgtB/PvdO family nonheme iron enzyme [Pseudomonadota bacterium]|nr:SUMF1/EgtB/PvdO family nonheme iron enzyme [Pseudomonadota bacterium]
MNGTITHCENTIVSSITQAKAEAQKLIKRYNRLQAEAKQADAAEAARKAAEAEKLVSQISALQGAITKLQARDREATTKKQQSAPKATPASPAEGLKQIESEKIALETRINRIEDAQKRTRAQIDQLTRAKAELSRLKQEAEKNAASIVQERRANDERLQQELGNLIQQKEAEHQNLKNEMEAIRAQAKKDAELLKIQRDAARAMMEKQKKLEEEKLRVRRGSTHKALWIGLGSGLIAAVLLIAGLFLFRDTLFPSSSVQTDSAKKAAETQTEAAAGEEKAAASEEQPKRTQEVKPIGTYRDRLASGGVGPLMVKLPEGSFLMGSKGSSPYQDERPQHEVILQSFSIGKHEITFEEYDRFIKATGGKLPRDQGWGRGERPVINVSWYDAVEYTKWLTEQTGNQYRLPSEREWEYAASAGTESPYWWGYEKGQGRANCAVCGSRWDGKQTAAVGSFAANNFGLHDVIGNVQEWTDSCYHSSYRGAPKVGQKWEGGNCSKRVVRSSSFRSYEKDLRVTRRSAYSPKTKMDTLGFRVVRVD